MLTVHATLQPDGQIRLPRELARGEPMPVLVTILEPLPEAQATTALPPLKGSVANLLTLLRSPQFVAIPRADPEDIGRRIDDLRNDWNGD